MKCQICGAELSKNGQICNNCSNRLKEERMLNDDASLNFTLKKRFNLGFQVGHYIEALVILIIMIVAACSIGAYAICIVFTAIMIGAFIVRMIITKKVIESYRYYFYDTKLVYQYDFIYKRESKTIKYSDIKEISFYQTIWERIFNFGRIVISTNSGNIFNNGIEIDNVYKVDEIYAKIREVTGK